MNQKYTAKSVCFMPLLLVLAIIIPSSLVLWAFYAHAEEVAGETPSVKDEVKANTQERRDLFQEQKDERQDSSLQSDENMVLNDSEEGSSEESKMIRTQAREEIQEMTEEQKIERVQLRITQREEIRSMFAEKANAMREELKTQKEERLQKAEGFKAKLEVQVQVRLGQYVERIVVRMSTAIDRLEQIANRVSTRINTTEEAGADLSDAKTELQKVYVSIDVARTYVTLFSDISLDTLTSETPSEKAQEVREAAKLAKDAIVTVHSALSDTVQLIKATNLEEETEGDSEPEEPIEGEEGVSEMEAQ
jgi:hypothetical protein